MTLLLIWSLNIRYRHDLHPRLPSEEFVMSELLDDAIGIYHRMFDFSGVCIPFSSFLLTLIKHYRVHVLLVGSPLGLNTEEPQLDVRRPRPTLQCFLLLHSSSCGRCYYSRSDPVDLPLVTLSFKILAKAEASQKRKASSSGATSSHVSKRTRSALAQLSGSTTRPSLFVGDDDGSDDDDDDDDVCVEIPSRKVNHYGAMDADAPSVGVNQPRSSSRLVPPFRDVSGDAIHTDFFPFSAGPYYATYPEGGVAGNCEFTREE
ncbi:hypothetical protein Tco_0885833 [Tanacetum coccineum]